MTQSAKRLSETEIPAALVTGAGRGVGRAAALYLLERGWEVFANVLTEDDGDILRILGSERLRIVSFDVRDSAAIRTVAKKVGELLGDRGLSGLVNAASVFVFGPLEFLEMEEIRRQFEVNVFGQLAVTQAFLPLLRRTKGLARIINIGAVTGREGMAFGGALSGAMQAFVGMSESLRLELQKFGIDVILVESGTISAPALDWLRAEAELMRHQLPPLARDYYGSEMESFVQSVMEGVEHGVAPKKVARAIHRALTHRRPYAKYTV